MNQIPNIDAMIAQVKLTKLPDKLSDLIDLALSDLEKARNDPRYEINMSAWHRPLKEPNALYPFTAGKCLVCLAGSVMAFSLGADSQQDKFPKDYDEDTCRKLNALDAIRLGEVNYALDILNRPTHTNMLVPYASIERDGWKYWKQQIELIADKLRAMGE